MDSVADARSLMALRGFLAAASPAAAREYYQESDWRRTASAVSDSRTSSLLISRLKLVLMIPSHAITFAAVNQLTAMDRQHPRDLFDVMELFAHGGITPAIRRAFVVYLASHNRTIHEVLFPTPKDFQLAYDGSFVGMTTEPVTLEALLDARRRLLRELPALLDPNERGFLRSLVRAQPDWSLLGIPHLAELPAIRWRLQNLEQLSRRQPARFRALAETLDERLGQ